MGLIESLGEGSKPEASEAPQEEGMLEQHLRAFKRALDKGDFKQAAQCFSAAMTEGSEPDPGDLGEGAEGDEGY